MPYYHYVYMSTTTSIPTTATIFTDTFTSNTAKFNNNDNNVSAGDYLQMNCFSVKIIIHY